MVEHASWKQLNGTTIGQYHLQRLLDQHQWGPIFLAADPANQSYAVRFIGMPATTSLADLPPEYNLVYLGRFQQAANQLTSLHHPRILPLLDYGTYRETPYLVYPYQKLTSLRSLLKATSSIDPLTAGQFLAQLVDALSYAHAHGVLHRNLSTLCIFTRPDRQLLIGEFGLFSIREIYKQYFPLPTGALADGTSEASAPEQWLNRPIGVSTDTYAMGAVLYRLLTKHAPFEGNSREEAMQKHLSAEPAPLSIWRADLPAGLDSVLKKALAKEPQQRFQRPEDLLLAYWQIVSPQEAARLHSSLITGSRPLAEKSFMERGASAQLPRTPISTRSSRHAKEQASQTSRRRLFTLLATGGAGAVAIVAAIELGLFHKSAVQSPQKTGIGSSGTTAGSTTVGNTASRPTGGTHQGKVVAHVADIPLNSAKTFPLSGQANPGIIVHLPNKQFVAFDSTCTHEQCAVEYTPSDHLLTCPCHGAAFDPANHAAVVRSPAPTPLTSVKISVNADGTITL